MLRIRDLNVSIGQIPIVRGASLELEQGDFCGLIGRNGAGKTTFMRGLMGALPASGSFLMGDVELVGAAPHRRVAHGIGYMPEDRRLVPEFTCDENIRLPAWSTRAPDLEARLRWIYDLIPEVAVARSRRGLVLSGGQQKLVALARALMAGRRLLLLDEPFEGLAPALARRLGEIFANLKSEGVTVLMAESTEAHVEDLLTRTFRIERGAVSPA